MLLLSFLFILCTHLKQFYTIKRLIKSSVNTFLIPLSLNLRFPYVNIRCESLLCFFIIAVRVTHEHHVTGAYWDSFLTIPRSPSAARCTLCPADIRQVITIFRVMNIAESPANAPSPGDSHLSNFTLILI